MRKFNVPVNYEDNEIKLFQIRCAHCNTLFFMADVQCGVIEVKCGKCTKYTTCVTGRDYIPQKDLL